MKRKGIALIGALFVLIVVSGLSLTLMTIVSAHTRSTNWNIKTTRAYFAAEAGLELKLAELNDPEAGDEAYEDLAGEIDGCRYEVTVREWDSDGLDNDNDGEIDDSGEAGYIDVFSEGTCGRASRIVRATIRLGSGTSLPGAFAAVHLYNPKDENGDVLPGAVINFSGSPPNIDGRDTAIPSTGDFSRLKSRDVTPDSGEGKDVLGIATHDEQSVSDVIDALGREVNRVFGIDALALPGELLEEYFFSEDAPEPETRGASVADISGFDPLDAQDVVQMAEQYESLAEPENVFNADNYPKGNSTFGTLDSPQITVIKNTSDHSITISGNISGAGVLVISGDVVFTGNINFAGVMVITSDGQAPVEMRGTPLIFGAIYAACSATDLESQATILDIRGTPDVFFSTEAMALAETALSGARSGGDMEVLAITEVGAIPDAESD